MIGNGKPIPECNYAEIRSLLGFGSLIASFIIVTTFWSHDSAPHYWVWCGRIFCIVWLLALWRGALGEFRLRTLAGTPPDQPRIQPASVRKGKRLSDWSRKHIAVMMISLFLHGAIAAAFACAIIFSPGNNSGSSLPAIIFLAFLSSIGFRFFWVLVVELRRRGVRVCGSGLG